MEQPVFLADAHPRPRGRLDRAWVVVGFMAAIGFPIVGLIYQAVTH